MLTCRFGVTVCGVAIGNISSFDDSPEEIKLGYIISIYKKGDRKLCKKYRRICVTNQVMRIMSKILSNRL